MRVIYKSFDGLDFDTAEECQHHENTEPLFKMYGTDGLTDDVTDAFVVHIINESDGARAFANLCDKQKCTSEGIDSWYGEGWYFWNGDVWSYPAREAIEAFKMALK